MTSTDRAFLRLVPPPPAVRPDEVPSPRGPADEPSPSAVEPVGDGGTPENTECLPCYVDRMMTREGCDGSLRWSRRWRDARAPRAAKLESRLADRGGFCDCEVLFNVYPWHFPVLALDTDTPDETGRPPCMGRIGGRATDPCRPPGRPWWG